ncbi:MAG: bifunctional riboflavin kinase/FAD synthetase [Moraxella sp.]|nr:bifunctional riboflavin kinase/FAD synthetase [Moraxella sp.]
MQLIHLSPTALLTPTTLPPLALTIGNFDGVHLGHQAMLSTLIKDAHQLGLAAAVMIFEPQPREFFNPANPPARLTNLAEKTTYLAELGVDYLLVAKFDDEFRSLSAAQFATLLHKMNAKHLVLGDDFRFGHDRVGDRDFLAKAGFSVDSLATVIQQDVRVSSTAVRQALAAGDLTLAKALLGREYTITGTVVHGDKIGRTLDYPTANIALARLMPAVQGIFAVDVLAYTPNDTSDTSDTSHSEPLNLHGLDWHSLDWHSLATHGKTGVAGLRPCSLFGAANIGTRPSVGGRDYRLEVHFPNFDADLYGLTLNVRFLHYLHGEINYASLDALKDGISKDTAALLRWREQFGDC